MAELDYDALQRLADGATPGPWLVDNHHWGKGIMDDDGDQLFIESHGLTYALFAADAEFIAASRSAIPALLDRVWELEAEVFKQRRKFDSMAFFSDDHAKRARSAEAERDAATAAIERVRAIHVRDEYGLCAECSWEYPETSYDALSNDVAWPCPTIAALDGAPEPEVKP